MKYNSLPSILSVLISVALILWLALYHYMTQQPDPIKKPLPQQAKKQAEQKPSPNNTPKITFQAQSFILPPPPASASIKILQPTAKIIAPQATSPKMVLKASTPAIPKTNKVTKTLQLTPKLSAQKPLKTLSPINRQKAYDYLDLLEKGKGPHIQIAWPQNPQEQAHIYQYLRDCSQMKTIVMSEKGLLYKLGGKKGQNWLIDTKKYSGFVRQTTHLQADEHYQIDLIKQFHHGLQNAQAVRIFPRESDAQLLGAISQLLPANHQANFSFQGEYAYINNQLTLTNIHINNQPIHHTIMVQQRCV